MVSLEEIDFTEDMILALPKEILQDAILCADNILRTLLRDYVNDPDSKPSVINKLKFVLKVIDKKEEFIENIDNNREKTIKDIRLSEILNKDIPEDLLSIWLSVIELYENSLEDEKFKFSFNTKAAIRNKLINDIKKAGRSKYNRDNPELLGALMKLKRLLTEDPKFRYSHKSEIRKYSGIDRFTFNKKGISILKYAIQFRLDMYKAGMRENSWRVI